MSICTAYARKKKPPFASKAIVCEDCGEDMQPGQRRRKCKNCGKKVCGWCFNHVHGMQQVIK
jgi:formylmethanofuran dehydrogenase subunit E